MGESKNKPDRIVQRGDQYQIRYNITQEERTTEEGGTENYYSYDHVEVDSITRKNIIDAMIRQKYDVNDELALVNSDHRTKEYKSYREYVNNCKTKASEIMNEID